ncbi:MAG: exo-alpha-sialidase [Gammaproteobacteria bacterium]|nr:exo-alpha-sialidase [Gammaproteobacteria bacterium]
MIKTITKLKDKIIYKDSNYYASFPSIVALENELFIVFRRARDSRSLLLPIDSDNDDEKEDYDRLQQQVAHIDSRSQLVSIRFDQKLNQVSELKQLSSDADAADQDASLLLLSNQHILLSSFAWYPIATHFVKHLRKAGVSVAGSPEGSGCHFIWWGGFTRKSTDQGKHWTKHNYLPALPTIKDIIPNKRHSTGGSTRGQAIEVNSELLLAVYRYDETFKTDTCHCYVSHDIGQNWIYRSTIAADHKQTIYFQEPSLIECNNGNIMAFMRTANAGDHLYTCTSSDNGKSWSKPICRDEIIGHPTHPLKLQDGSIFLSYGYRHEPYGIRARIMDGNGENFISDEIILRDDGLNWDVGYPWAVQLNNGHVLVVYYFCTEDSIRHIASTEVEIS